MGIAIVTGAARGIGAATALALCDAGHQLVLVDRVDDDPRLSYPLASPEQLQEVATRCEAETVIGDVADPATGQRAVEVALTRWGRLDIAVATAGAMADGATAWATPEQSWQVCLDTNLFGAVHLAAAAIPAMTTEAGGQRRFVAVSSSIVDRATPLLASYAAAKAALQTWARCLAADLADTGVTVNVVQPGSTNTDLLSHSAQVYDLDSPTAFADHHLDAELIEPGEVAATIAWLCSPQASAVNAAVIPVDRGMTAR